MAKTQNYEAFYENEIVQLDSKEVYYFESVDNKVYACCEKKVFEIKQKLYELEEIYKQTDFVRISKSMIVNISKVSKIVPMFNGRLEGVLCNGEKVIITRQYVANLKKKLGLLDSKVILCNHKGVNKSFDVDFVTIDILIL